MIEALGSRVLKLVRTAIGPIRIGELAIGKWRMLEPEEVRRLGAEVQLRAAARENGSLRLASRLRTRRISE